MKDHSILKGFRLLFLLFSFNVVFFLKLNAVNLV